MQDSENLPNFALAKGNDPYKRGHPINNDGVIAQLVEQRTENPCVPGSIPGDTTENQRVTEM